MTSTAVHCDIGLRESLEDGALAAHYTIPSIGRVAYLTACDGVGGHQFGEVASALALAHIHGSVAANMAGAPQILADVEERSDEIARILNDTFLSANQLILGEAQAAPELSGMATTVVCVVVLDDTLVVAWAGDSRCYLLSEDRLRRVTRDHSRVQELLDTGLISLADAASHPEAHTITRYLGQPEGFAPELRVCSIRPGDTVLLCTDGVTDVLADSDIERLMNNCLAARSGYRRLPNWLIEEALAAGASDNLTVLCYQHEATEVIDENLGRTSTGEYPVVVARTLHALHKEIQDEQRVHIGAV